MRIPRTRRVVASAAAALLASVVLVSCGGDGDTGNDGKDGADGTDGTADATTECTSYPSGAASDSVKVPGDFGKAHDAEFKTPIEVDSLERTVLTEGDRDITKAGDVVDALVSVYLGKDGSSLGTQELSITAGDGDIIEAFTAGVECVPLGSRVVVAVPASEMYGDQGNPDLGLEPDDPVVIVTDLIDFVKPLEPEPWTDNPPKVSFDKDGKPTLTLPKTDPPKKLLLKVLREGDGDTIASGDKVDLDYQGTSWDTGEIFDQSFGKPATQDDCERVCFATTGVVPGFGAALVGQKVGTRLVVTMPPEDAYGPAGGTHELAGQTLVFVIDIVGVTPAGS